jgi:hypothetical protein
MPSLASPAERSQKTRIVLALGVLGIWLFAALPFLTGAAQCPTAGLFHKPCPGCGMTRALLLLAHGDLAGSIAMHPLAVPAALAQIALAVATIVVTLQRGTPFAVLETRYGRASVMSMVVVLVFVVGVWIARAFGAFGGPVSV